MCGCLLCAPTRDLACNPGMCPDWEFNQGPFGSQVSTQSTEPHQPGLLLINSDEKDAGMGSLLFYLISFL